MTGPRQRLQISLPARAGVGVQADGVQRRQPPRRFRAARGQRLARGSNQRDGNLVQRALRLWVEGADGLDLVAEELDARGPLHRWGEDINDATAMRDVARLLDLGLEVVAQRHQPLQYATRIAAVAGA